MRDGTHITVVHEGETIDAITVKLGYPGWAAYPGPDDRHGPLGDEHVHWIRGWLWPRLWPPHRKRAAALVTAAALGPPVAKPPTPAFNPQTWLNSITKQFDADVLKIMGDATKLVQNAERLALRSTRRQVKFRRY